MESKRNKRADMEDKTFNTEFAAEEAMTADTVAAAPVSNYAEEVGEEIAPAAPKQEEQFAGGMTVSPEILADSVNVPKGVKHTQLEELAKQYKGSEFDQTGKNVPKYEE